MNPQVILLNGTGSSGKTSIAKILQDSLSFQYLNFSIDSILYALPPSDLKKMMKGQEITREGYHFPDLVTAYHQCLPVLINTKCRLLIDNAWVEDAEKLEILEILSPFDVFIVGVQCDLEVAKAREIARGDRAIGLANWQHPLVHKNMHYDFTVDTTNISPEQAAKQILSAIQSNSLSSGATLTLKELAKIKSSNALCTQAS